MDHWNKKSQQEFLEALVRETMESVGVVLRLENEIHAARMLKLLAPAAKPPSHDHPEWV